ncbi:hypothetical protein MFUL124B02_04635 [Myxococcus fulvus 124B02]|nr:hypothetical protein MFUL124B02_04635 [Myxococcus fulvus 124B02]
MKTAPRQAWDWLALEPHQRHGLRALQLCLGLMLLFRASTEGRFAAYLWGPQGLGEGSSDDFLSAPVARLADGVYTVAWGPTVLVVLMGAAAISLVFGWATRLATAVALLSSLFLAARLPELGDGGDNVARLVLTYMLFALPAHKVPRRGSLEVWLHNIAILAIGLQTCVLYLTSGFLKATGDKWSNGTALYLVSQVEWFSHPSMRQLFHNPYLTTAASYTTLFYQLWFPVAVLTRLRLPFLAFGLLLHLGIAGFMGLVCFSLAMMGLELFLITDEEYARAARWKERFGRALRARFRVSVPKTEES